MLVERTAAVHDEVTWFIRTFLAEHPEIDPAEFPGGLSDQLKSELMRRGMQLRADLHELERRSIVTEICRIAAGGARPAPAVG